jgi:uncharacterized membrane protein (DUF373 family)
VIPRASREGAGGSTGQDAAGRGARSLISAAFGRVQDLVYAALGVLLAVSALAVLVHGGVDLARAVGSGVDARAIVALLDRALLALMIVELLYTVQVSFREHVLVPEPFLLVALIAAVRRILVVTAELGAQPGADERVFQHVMWELAILAMLVVVLVASVVVLRQRPASSRHEAAASRD